MTQAETPLLLELKDPKFAGRRYAQKLIAVLACYNMLNRVAIISFQAPLVRSVKLVYPPIAAGYVTLNDPRPPRDAELAGSGACFQNIVQSRHAVTGWHFGNDIQRSLDAILLDKLHHCAVGNLIAVMVDDNARF